MMVMTAFTGHADDMEIDPGAEAFLKHCMRCHTGILTGNDLQNTVLSTTTSLDKTVRRMEQQHTAPLTEKQIADLVELMKDREIKFRLEEAELMQDGPMDVAGSSASAGIPVDLSAKLYMQNCAACHTIGGGRSFGGDLTHTSGWAIERLRGDVSRMQARVGQMSDEQIDGLVDLLKASDRGARLAAAGYKPPRVPAATPRLTPEEKAAQIAHVRAEAVRQKISASRNGTSHDSQTAPYGILFGSLALAAVGSIVVYRLAKGGE